jgi:hypothetical protein
MAAVKIVVLPNPFMLDWGNWRDTVTGYNPGLINVIDPDTDYPEFAERFCQVVPEAPRPDVFPAWQDWAAATKHALQV